MARDSKITSRIMSSIKSSGTKPELVLGRALWALGLRYRKQYKIDGKPDFVFIRPRVAVFCDGDFWHGNNWRLRKLSSLEEELSGYTPFWREKILRNIERDKKVNQLLKEQGWEVVRFWESDILSDAPSCAKFVQRVLQERKKSKIVKAR